MLYIETSHLDAVRFFTISRSLTDHYILSSPLSALPFLSRSFFFSSLLFTPQNVGNMIYTYSLLPLLASVASAQRFESKSSSNCTLMATSAPIPKVPAGSVLPYFGLATSGTTITPPSSSVHTVISTSTIIVSASHSSVRMPASESFNASNAPAFTSGIPSPPGPMYPSTPCAHEVTSTSIRGYPVGDFSSISSALPDATTAPGKPTSPVVPVFNTTRNVTSPVKSPMPEAGSPKPPAVPLDASRPIPMGTGMPPKMPPFPVGTGMPARPPLFPTGGSPALPPFPIGTDRPGHGHRGGRPGFEHGRPRPSSWAAWPGRGAARPTGGLRPSGFDIGQGRPDMEPGAAQPTGSPRPSAGFDIGKNKPGMGPDAAATMLHTLETRVRPTPSEVLAACRV